MVVVGVGYAGDGNHDWKTANADSAGLDSEALSALVSELHADTYPNIHSLLIARNGNLVLEEYFFWR